MPAGFFSGLPLRVETSDGRNVTLLAPFSFTRPNGEVVTFAAGGGSDGASAPPPMWPELPPFGVYYPAAVGHDQLYRYSTRPKAECDTIFLEMMECLQVPEDKKIQLYEGVHLFGWSSFEDDRKVESAPTANLGTQQEETAC